MHRGRRDSVAFTVVVGILVLIGGLAMALVVGLSGAPGSLALAALLAALPVGPVSAAAPERFGQHQARASWQR